MRTVALLLVASLLMFGLAIAPTASAAPGGGGGGGEVCVPGLTLCCSVYDDGDITPMVRCL